MLANKEQEWFFEHQEHAGWSVENWIKKCAANSKAHGFHDPGTNDNYGAQLANIHGEVSESWEETRKGDFDPQRVYYGPEKPCEAIGCKDGFVVTPNSIAEQVGGTNLNDKYCVACNGTGKVRKPEGLPVELADIVIRVFDMVGFWNIDLLQAMQEKYLYNMSRPFRHGGKRS